MYLFLTLFIIYSVYTLISFVYFFYRLTILSTFTKFAIQLTAS